MNKILKPFSFCVVHNCYIETPYHTTYHHPYHFSRLYLVGCWRGRACEVRSKKKKKNKHLFYGVFLHVAKDILCDITDFKNRTIYKPSFTLQAHREPPATPQGKIQREANERQRDRNPENQQVKQKSEQKRTTNERKRVRSSEKPIQNQRTSEARAKKHEVF